MAPRPCPARKEAGRDGELAFERLFSIALKVTQERIEVSSSNLLANAGSVAILMMNICPDQIIF